MGIYNFFTWFKKNFSNEISFIPFLNNVDKDIDIFMIDLNGIIHNSAQKIYKYGKFNREQTPRLLSNNLPIPDSNMNEINIFKDITKTLNILFNKINPKSKFIVCIDGPAPMAKQYQQRKRRFKNNSTEMNFDPNCITPGTEFMDNLSRYIYFLKF